MSKDEEREEQRLTNAEDTDHRHSAAANACLRAAAAAATEKARRMVPGGMERSDKAPQAIPKNGWCPAGWRESGSYCIR